VSDTIRNEIDKTALSYWYPKLVEAGIPVPRTKIVKMPDKARKVIWKLFDGIVLDGEDLSKLRQHAGVPCEDGRFVCSHPYWPMDSLVEGGFDISHQAAVGRREPRSRTI
jgi:hypothetical protein